MNLTTLRAEFLARGFQHLDAAGVTTRQDQYLNAGRADLDRMFLWPWREKVATGAGTGVAISDLGPIELVQNTSLSSSPIARADQQSLTDTYGDLTISGTPIAYYVAWASGTPTVKTYPSSTNTISVQYFKVTPDLTAGSDTPASPAEAHMTIVDLAVRRAYNDSDNFFSASMIQSEIDRAVQALLVQYPPRIPDGPDAFVGVTGASSDW